jgi:hypothetical protein
VQVSGLQWRSILSKRSYGNKFKRRKVIEKERIANFINRCGAVLCCFAVSANGAQV